ncbi:MAG: PhnD/SsuA/transferrin family substrate-binding protein [Planctomycetaceae bacterium]|nr:PhnD/SsuA/transferrin family substrate-binding protein [Planctomycetaceae bacterium]
MGHCRIPTVAWAMLAALFAAAPLRAPADDAKSAEGPISMLVMDPLALPLSCPCVAGYAQRKYEVLGDYLSQELGRPVEITFAESIKNALDKEHVDDIHLIIGKDSVVRAQSKKHKYEPSLLARLVGKDGNVNQTGLIVVRSADPAKTLSELNGYRILFGPPECDEKFSAARELLEEAGVDVPAEKEAEISYACSDGACMIIDWGDKIHGAAVISSYAAPLLEGCGTIKKGDLRVIGETKPVPFVAAFATNSLDKEEQKKVQDALLKAGKAPGMLAALETMLGFVPEDFKPIVPARPVIKPAEKPTATQPPAGEAKTSADVRSLTIRAWPGWLGPERNGRVEWLPDSLPAKLDIVWSRPFLRPGMGGLAATDRHVFVGDRDAANRADVFRCLDATNGDERWSITQPALGQLDYDNLPRATPLIYQDKVLFFGAFGDLVCAEMETGRVAWRMNVRLRFLALDKLPWGTCSSPLLVNDTVVVNPGAPRASIAAVDAATGETRWQTPGEPQGYGSLIAATLGGVRQIVGHTQSTLCGWNAETGERLWSLKPRTDGDFNVPTPIVIGDELLVATENNGGRLYRFREGGEIEPEQVAVNTKLNPQMSTPIAVGRRVFCVNRRLDCFDAADDLKNVWTVRDRVFCEFGAAIATDSRVLVQGRGGELVLIDVSGPEPAIVSRSLLTTDKVAADEELLTFPALVGSRLFLRNETAVVCIELGG